MKAVGIVLATVVSGSALLAACGQKGALYLPGEAPPSQAQGPFDAGENAAGRPQSSQPGADEPTTDSGDDAG